VGGEEPQEPPLSREPALALARQKIPARAYELVGTYLHSAHLLGQRTAELHVALARPTDDPSFAPEAFTPFYKRSLYQSMRNMTAQNVGLLRKKLRDLHEPDQALGKLVLDAQSAILDRFRAVHERKITAMRVRTHGDYHLGQVLYTGKDFVIIDFEGEPARSLSERRLKRSPLRDVAGMLRSFDYAASTVLGRQVEWGHVSPDALELLGPWARFWVRWAGAAFLKTYLETTAGSEFLPGSAGELEILLNAYVLLKAVYELGYELNNRPSWVGIPLKGILEILEEAG
jgi:maltose alpha-D-glucosyltransferase/alpha-amylase